MRNYRNYTDDDIIRCASEVTSLAQLLKALGLVVAGGNYDCMKKNLSRLDVDTSHWKGKGWSSGDRLKDWKDFKKSDKLKPHLIRERGHMCESCGNFLWLGEKIKLEMHHVDGSRLNNSYDNLQLLCPNCHSCTTSWRKAKDLL